MALQTCPTCRTANPADNGYCGNCGAELRRDSLIISQPAPLQIGESQLATPQVKALAVTVAVGLTTLLAEAGLVYLQRRVSRMQRPSLSLRRRKKPAVEPTAIVPTGRRNGRVITVVGERVVEERRWGRPMRRVVERFAWRGEEVDS